MKVTLVVSVCLLALSGWTSGFIVSKRQSGGNAVAATKKEPPEEEPSEGTFQSDMKLGVFKADVEERIQDMKTGRERRKAFANLNYRWPGGVIPYVITESSAADGTAIENAMDLWRSQTCLNFEPYNANLGHQGSIHFSKGDGCWSYIGMQGTSSQEISIGTGCSYLGTIAHEIGHAIGFHHEQSRSDRDDYVSIIYDNIKAGMEQNFVKYEAETESLTHGLPYDPTSIMHYNLLYFSDNGKATIITKKPLAQFDLGQRDHLSFYDVYLANILYNCISDCSDTLVCQNNGFEAMVGGLCRCTCPPGFSGAECEVDDTAAMSNCRYELTEASGTLESPNYPANYDNGLRCAWYIKGDEGSIITLTFDDIDVEYDGSCSWDAVAVRKTNMFDEGEKFCGTSLPSVQDSITNEMMVVLTSDVSYTGRGFKAHYVINQGASPLTDATPVSESAGSTCAGTCGGTLSDSGCLASPNFPGNYGNNADCTWTIEVAPGSRVALEVSSLDVGILGTTCLDDTLQVGLAGDDNTQVRPLLVCGSNLPSGPIISLDNKMTLHFTSDSDFGSNGFEASFHTLTI